MSATTTPTDFSDLVTAVRNRVRADTSTAVSNILKNFVNDALHDVHIGQNWWWAERRAIVQTHATYTTGTVAIALATRTTVTGTSTEWNTAVTGMGFNNARAGGKMTFAGASDVYTVSSVGSDTSITLADRFIGSTALTAATYTYFEDEYALASDFWRTIDQRKFTDDLPIEVIPRQEFYRRYPRNSTTGTPQVATILELGPSGDTVLRPRIVFHPAPSTVVNISYRYITTNLALSSAGVGAANLSADADEPIIPLRYRRILVLHAAREWYRDRKDDQRSQEVGAEYIDLWRRMSGDSLAERDRPRFVPRTHQYLATVAGPLRRGNRPRYGTGTWFDEVR